MLRHPHLIFFLFVTLLLPAKTILASNQDCAVITEQLAALTMMVDKNEFNTERNLMDYQASFGKPFIRAVDSLSEQQTWIDFGAGQANATVQYHYYYQQLHKRLGAKTIAVGIKRWSNPRTISVSEIETKATDQGKFRYLEGRMVEDIPDAELATFDLGTDFYGPLTYSIRLSEVLSKYIRLLKKDTGRLFLHIAEGHVNQTFIKSRKKPPIPLSQWLSQIPGLAVTLTKSRTGESLVVELRKTSDQVHIPKLLLEDLHFGAPPARTFQVIDE